MAQQINLFSPIHAAPRRAFAARTMAVSLAVLAAGLGALGTWMTVGGAVLRHEMQASATAQAAERQKLERVIASRRGGDTASSSALEQEHTRLVRDVQARRALVDDLLRGRLVEGRGHAAVLRMIASTVPDVVWLDRIRVGDGSLELAGMTLDPQALRPWLARLADHPLTRDQRLGTVKLERVAASASASQRADERERWAFVLSSQVPRAAAAPVESATAPVAVSLSEQQPGAAR